MAKLAPRNVRLRKSAKSTIGRFWISSAATKSANRISGRQELGARRFRRPADAIGADQRPDETKEPAAKREHARNVQSLRVRIAELFDGVNREPDERRAEGKIDEKRPAPAKSGSNQPADQRTHGDGDADDRSPKSERLGAFRAPERVPQHRERRAELEWPRRRLAARAPR